MMLGGEDGRRLSSVRRSCCSLVKHKLHGLLNFASNLPIPAPGTGSLFRALVKWNFPVTSRSFWRMSQCHPPQKNREQILAMADMGITLIVTLTEETPLPQEWFMHSGVRNLFVPVPNYHPPTVPQADAVLAAIVSTVDGGGKVMVHCGGGKGRAGTMAACVILRYGDSSVAAAVRTERAGGTSLSPLQSSEVLAYLRDQRPESVETERQERFIREYSSTLWQRLTEGSSATAWYQGASDDALVVGEKTTMKDCAKDVKEQRIDATATVGSVGAASGSRGGAKAKREEREAEKRLKDLQKRAPKYIMTVGLAGSGKSTFSKSLQATGCWVRANQDDLGAKACMKLISETVPAVRRGTTHLIVDRCHLTRNERKDWLDKMGGPAAKEVSCVFFDCSAEDCKQRAAARMDHPTIRPGGGQRIIEDQAQKLERPEKSEGFGSVDIVRSFNDVKALLARLGAAAPATGSAIADRDVVPAEMVVSIAEESSTAMSAEVEAEPSLLPSDFAEWLCCAIREELSEADAEGILAGVEMILSGACEEPDAIANAQEVLNEAGAPRCAEQLELRWASLVAKA